VQVSPSTEAVVRTIADSASPLLTDEPSLLGNGDSLWLASGPGTATAIATLAPGRFVPTQVYAESGSEGVEWLAAVDGNVWANVTNNGIPHLVELSPTGALLQRAGPQLIGDTPLVIAGTTLWASGVAASCNSPLQVWRSWASHRRMIHDSKLQAAHCLETPSWTGRWCSVPQAIAGGGCGAALSTSRG
jgi:hypothetical protein